jgi:hypothetical protein
MQMPRSVAATIAQPSQVETIVKRIALCRHAARRRGHAETVRGGLVGPRAGAEPGAIGGLRDPLAGIEPIGKAADRCALPHWRGVCR